MNAMSDRRRQILRLRLTEMTNENRRRAGPADEDATMAQAAPVLEDDAELETWQDIYLDIGSLDVYRLIFKVICDDLLVRKVILFTFFSGFSADFRGDWRFLFTRLGVFLSKSKENFLEECDQWM